MQLGLCFIYLAAAVVEQCIYQNANPSVSMHFALNANPVLIQCMHATDNPWTSVATLSCLQYCDYIISLFPLPSLERGLLLLFAIVNLVFAGIIGMLIFYYDAQP